MDYFEKVKSVRFRSYHDKYLIADDDGENVIQDRNGTVTNAKWTVETVDHSSHVLRFKSCYGKYLTASSAPLLLGITGKKVLQTLPSRLGSSVEWEPIREGVQVKLKTRYGLFLRANGGMPPLRNHITHDIPHRTSRQNWILWDVDIVEIKTEPPRRALSPPPPPPPEYIHNRVQVSDSLEPNSPKSMWVRGPELSKQESSHDFVASPVKNEGRVIYYCSADENGDVEENEEQTFNFLGNELQELKVKLEEETGLNDILVCSRNPLNGKLYPLRLHLPPNNTSMHVVVVLSSGKDAENLVK